MYLHLPSATAACIVKVYYLTFFGRYNDFLWDSVNITIWTSCELNIGIFAASIATLRPLFRATFGGSSADKSTEYRYSTSKNQLDKSSFVRHISNSRGLSKIGSSDEIDLELYGNVVTAGRKWAGAGNESEESILYAEGIMKTTTTQVDVSRQGKGDQ